MGPESNITRVFIKRGKFGHTNMNIQGEDGHMKMEAVVGVVLNKEHLGTPGPGRGKALP